MADVRTVLFESLRADASNPSKALAAALGDVDLASARAKLKDEPTAGEAAAAVIGRMLADGSTPDEVVDVAKAIAARAPRDDGGNEVVLVAAAAIWRLSGQPALAEPLFRRVRRSEPGHPEVLSFYRELFAGDAGAAQLIQVLVQARRAEKDPELRFALAQEVATLAEERQGSADRAIETWRSVVRDEGYDPRAVRALERLYRDGGKWTALVDLLKEESERLPQGKNEQRIAKLLEIAALYRDRLKLDTMALATLQRILDVDPHHEASLEALAETYAKAGRHNDLLGVYARRIDAAKAAGDVDRQIELHRRVAEIWLDQLGNPQRAIEPLQKVLELRARDEGARKLMARIHEQRRDFRALIALRRQELPYCEGETALELRMELARTAEERLGDRREAIAAYDDVLAHHGDVAPALVALGRLYERESRWAAAAEVLHRQIALVSASEATGLLAQLGSIYSDRLQDRPDGIAVWAELLRLSPGHDRAIRRLRDAYVADGAWDDLHRLYAGQGRLADLVDVMQGAADRLSDTAARVALYRRVAALCKDDLGQPERAVRALERTLSIQPDNLEVARELVPIYREQRNWARLLSTHEVLLRAATDPAERLKLVRAMQEIAEHKLASPVLTLSWAAEAYRLAPADGSIRAALESAAERADGWDELSRIFEQRIAKPDVEDEERLVLLDKLAAIARDKLSKPDDAQRYYRRIIALDPTNSAAMSALESIYSGTRRWEDLAEVYRRRLDVESTPTAKLTTLRALARLYEEQLGDLDGAVSTHVAILELDPEAGASLDSLARIHRNRGNWAELAAVLARKLERESGPTRRVPIMFELADIRANRLGDSEQATEGFLAVLEIDAEHKGAVAALESLRESTPALALPIMRGLLPYYRRVEDRRKEAEAMEVIVGAEQDPELRLDLYEQLAAIYEKMEDRRLDALRIRGELFRADPSHWQGRQVLVRLGGELGRVEDVAHAYADVLRAMAVEADEAEDQGTALPKERVALRRDLLLEHASTLRDKLGRPDEAERVYAVVLDQDETHQGAYEALETLLRARGANRELRDLYRRRVDVTFNPREQRSLLSLIVELSRTVLDDRESAIATAEELLDLIPDDLATIELLAGMYSGSSDRADRVKLEELLGRWAELERDPTRARQLQVRRAMLRMQEIGDAFGAVDLLGQVLGEDPDDAAARGLLEELLSVSEVQLQACALLEPIYVRRGDHEGRIRVLQVRREHAEEQGARDQAVNHLIEIARIREHELHDPTTAFAALREAYLQDPRRFDTRTEVERLGLGLGRFADLVEIWREALQSQRLGDKTVQIDLTRRIAELLDARLRDAAAARQAWTDLLELDPPDVTLAQRAVEALCRLHLEAGDGPALVSAKRALLRFTSDTEDHVRIRLEIAEIQEQLGDRVAAAMTYSEVLDLEPGNMQALDALERLFLEEQEWSRLTEVLEHRVAVTADPRARAGIYRQIGEIRRDQLDDSTGALSAFQSILDLKVGRDDTAAALRALVMLNENLERWADVDEGLRRLVGLADADHVRVALLTRAAVVVGRRLARGQDALDLLKRVLDLAPTHADARKEAAHWLESDETRDRALRILMPLYEAEQNWTELLALEELQARKQPSGRRRLQALLRVAKTQEERIGDPDRAFGVLCEAMAEAADQPELAEILAKVERLGGEPQRALGLWSAYNATADHILEAELQQRVLLAMGRVALDRLDQPTDARSAFERVLALAPGDTEAADALERVYLQLEEYEPLANLLTARADRTTDVATRDAWLVRSGDIMRRQLERPEDAIRIYERLSADSLARPEVQDALEPLYEATGRWRELAALLARRIAQRSGKAAVEAHLRLGRLYGEKLEDPGAGIRHLSAALKLDPDQAIAAEELGRYLEDPSMRVRVAEMLEPVFAAVGAWSRLIQIQEIRLAEAADEGVRSKILLRIAQIEEEQLEDLDRAFDSYTRLFKEQPGNRYVRDQLARLAGVLEQSVRYAELLTRYADEEGATDESPEMLSIVREAADLWAGPLRQPARAVPLYRRLREVRPDDAAILPLLESSLTQAESWRDLADLYWREVDTAPSEDRQIDLLRKLATLAQELLDDPEEAVRAYQRMLDIRPDYEIARTRLEQLLEGSERHADLLDALRDRIARTDHADERNRIALRIARLQDGPLEDPEGAIDTLDAMLGEVPGDPDAVEMLEQVAQARSSMRPRILGMLRPIYERSSNLRRIVEIDEWQLAHTTDPVTRHELYFEIATLLSRNQDTLEAALSALMRALAEPGPAEALGRLDAESERLATLLQMEAQLAEALAAAAHGEALRHDVDRRVDLLVRAAQVRHAIGEAQIAVTLLRDATELEPDHLPALVLLDTALGRIGDHESLAGVLEHRAELATDPRERMALLRRLAVLQGEALENAAKAEDAWRAVLELEPGDREALRELARAYEKRGASTELVDVLERQIETTEPGSERRDLRLRLAELHREAADRSAEVDTLRALLVESESDTDALALLSDALLVEERHEEAVEVLGRRAELARSDAERAGLLLEAARLQAGPLGDTNAAIGSYARVLELESSSSGALGDLVALAKQEHAHEAATQLLVSRLPAAGRWRDLADLWAARAELVHDDVERADALRQLAKVRLERLDDPAGARAAWIALVDAVDGDALTEALDQGGRLAVQLGIGAEHVDLLETKAAEIDREPASRVTLARNAARLCEEVLGEGGRALEILAPVLSEGLATLDVCAQVERLGRANRALPAVEQALREAARLAPDEHAQAQTLVRLGDVQLELDDRPGALESYRDAFDLGRDPAAVRGLETILGRVGDKPPLALLDALEGAYVTTSDRVGQTRIVEARLRTAGDSERPRLLEQLAVLHEQGAGSSEQALHSWGELLALDPESASTTERVLVLARGGLQREAAAVLLAAIASGKQRKQFPLPLALAASSLLLRDLGDSARALETIRELLAVEPDHPEGIEIGIEAARAAHDPETLHALLRRAAENQPDPQREAALLREAAQVADTELRAPDRAIEDLERLLAIDEQDAAGWQRLLTLLRNAGEFERLADSLGRRALVVTEAEERRDLRRALARVQVEQLDRPDDAVATLNDALDEAPEDTDIIAELETLLARLERWDDVRDVLQRRLAQSEGSSRVEVLEELARLAEDRLGDPIDAIENYQQILQEEPGHVAAQGALERLLAREERYSDLARVLEDRMARHKERGEVDAYRAAASTLSEVLAERLGDAERAQTILGELLELDPGYVPAILALASVYEARGDEGAMRITLQRAVDLKPGGATGAQLHLRLAKLAGTDSDARRGHLMDAFRLDPSDAAIGNELLALCRRQERWTDVAELLEGLEERAPDSAARRNFALERCDLLLGRLDDPEGALRVLAPVYTEVQDDPDINRRIADALYSADRIDEAEGMYNWLVEVGRRGKRSKLLGHDLTRLARIALKKEDGARARDLLQEAYRIDTTNVETLMTLGNLYESEKEWKESLKIYRTMLLQNADQSGKLRRGDIYIGLARAHIMLQEKPKAKAMLRRGLEEDASHPELNRELERIDE